MKHQMMVVQFSILTESINFGAEIEAYRWKWTMQTINNLSKTLTADIAKIMVYDHWGFLTNLACTRFPDDAEISDQSLSFVLYRFEEQAWQRIREWDGSGSFKTFLAVLASRQITDFVRSRFGCHRPPAWLQQKKDAIWQKTFRLYTVEKYKRKQAIEVLVDDNSEMSRDQLEEIVNTVYSKCSNQALFDMTDTMANHKVALPSVDSDTPDNNQLTEVLVEYIQSNHSSTNTITDNTTKDLLNHLKLQISCSDEDRLLLRLKFCEGLPAKQISQMLHFQGSLNTRMNVLIDDFRSVCNNLE
jgi:DNA-directed RNA polymerase specialized sigma24 family protein